MLDPVTHAVVTTTVRGNFRDVVTTIIAAESLPPGRPIKFEFMADPSASPRLYRIGILPSA
jgi:hypothetical protein